MESQQIVGLITVHDQSGKTVHLGVTLRYQNAVDNLKLTALNNPGWEFHEEKEKVTIVSPTGWFVVATQIETDSWSLINIDGLWPETQNEQEQENQKTSATKD